MIVFKSDIMFIAYPIGDLIMSINICNICHITAIKCVFSCFVTLMVGLIKKDGGEHPGHPR